MIFALALLLPIGVYGVIWARSRAGQPDGTRPSARGMAGVFFAIPALYLAWANADAAPKTQVFFIVMQWLWLPLVIQDYMAKAVTVVGLAVVTAASIAATWALLGLTIAAVVQAATVVALFGAIHILYRRYRGRDPFGMGDYPVLAVLPLTLAPAALGPWIMIASLLVLAQAWGQSRRLSGSVAMIPLLYLSWQFCVTVG